MENIQNFRADLFSIFLIFQGHFSRYIFLKKSHISNVNKGRGRGRGRGLILYDMISYDMIAAADAAAETGSTNGTPKLFS